MGIARMYSTGIAGVDSFRTASDSRPEELSQRAPVVGEPCNIHPHKQEIHIRIEFMLTLYEESMDVRSLSRRMPVIILGFLGDVHRQAHPI